MSDAKVQNDYSDPYAYPNDFGDEDLQGLGENIQGDDEGFGDGYSNMTGNDGSPSPLSTYEEAQARLEDLLAQASSDPQLKVVLADIDHLKSQVKNKHGKIPQNLANQIQALEAEVYAQASGDSSDSINLKKLENEIDQLKIPDEKKQELKTKLIAHDLHGGENDGSLIEGIQQEVELYKKHPYAAVSLAEQLGGVSETGQVGQASEEEIANLEKLAAKHGVNLENIPNPPAKEMIEFLKEASPDLAEKFDAVKKAAQDRQSFYQDNLTKAKAQNESNLSSKDDTDNKDVSVFQHLYDVKYYQDEKSKALASAMQDATQSLKPLLEAVYSGQKVEIVTPPSGSGWQLAYNQAQVADQITVGGTSLDIFNNTTGELQVATTSETENIETVTVEYQSSGKGSAWMPTGNGYGEEFKKHDYDDRTTMGQDAKTGAKVGAAVGTIGAVVGTVILPGVGTLGGAAIGLAGGFIVGTVGGALVGAVGDFLDLW